MHYLLRAAKARGEVLMSRITEITISACVAFSLGTLVGCCVGVIAAEQQARKAGR